MSEMQPISDGPQPICQVVLCGMPANYRAADRDGEMTYVCDEHRPFIHLMSRPPGSVTESRYHGPPT
jgi:hypothetical protein